MYSPKQFLSYDLDEIFEFIKYYPFATLITLDRSSTQTPPQISHLPVYAERDRDKIVLYGHLSRANSHSRTMSGAHTTIIFHGPHTYITPKWYVENNVPTWCYSVLHLTGHTELIETEDGIISCLRNLSELAEKRWPSGWDFYVPEELAGDKLTKSITAFKITCSDFVFKKKLNQSRPLVDQMKTIAGLETRDDENSYLVRQEMMNLISKK